MALREISNLKFVLGALFVDARSFGMFYFGSILFGSDFAFSDHFFSCSCL